MSDIERTRCPHCHAELEESVAGSDFWVRCGGCGRRVMPKSWSRIVNDPEPSAFFRPSVIERRNTSGPARFRHRPVNAGTARNSITAVQVYSLAIPAIVVSAASCLLFSQWYTASDMLICGFMGLLLTVFVVYVPALLVSVGTGAITLAFFSALFGFSGNEFFRGSYYFLFGFVMASVLQFVSRSMTEGSQRFLPQAEPETESTAVGATVATHPN